MKKKSGNPNQSKPKRKFRWKRLLLVFAVVIALFITSVGIFFGVTVYQQISGFSKEALLNEESSVQISTVTGKEYHTYGANGARRNVSYDDIPQVMIDAVVAAEDSRFFEHNGFDLPRILKAFVGNVSAGGITGGGSTITQQVIKNSIYPNVESETLIEGVQRKIGEVVLSAKTTSETTKEEVLELYLNKIYFGYGTKAIGIYAASRYYFDKSVQNLTLPEAALLAGTLNSPNSYDPFRNLDLAQQRRDTILDLMELHGYITHEECEKTKAIPVENTLKNNPLSSGEKYRAYIDMVTREVVEKTGLDPETTAMKIYTYMDPDLQTTLDDIASSKSYTFYDKDIQAGACVQESTTGRVIGVLSQRNYEPGGVTYAYAKKGVKSGGYGQAHQPGSSLKPIIAYAASFEFLDYSTAHYVHDVPLDDSTYNPKNFDNKFHGDVSISNALANSWNLAAIQTYLEVYREVGEDKIVDYLSGFGFDMTDETLKTGYAIGGWDYGVTPQEEAAAYAAISNGGTYIEPHAVDRIEIIATGEVIELDKTAKSEKSTAISEESAFMIRQVMTDYVKTSKNYSYVNLGYQIGAKTGTSTYSSDSSVPSALRGKSKDSWFTAYSPDYSWSVWVGYPEKIANEKGKWLQNGTDARKISGLIAKQIHKGGLKNSYPSQPNGVVKATCVTGIYPYIKPGEGVPKDRIATGYFKKANTPTGSASAAAIKDLEMFEVTLTDKNQIQVEFTDYGESAKTTKVYTSRGKKYELPYLGDVNQIFGNVVYTVEVVDSTGKVVHTESLTKPKGTLKYTPQAGTYTIRGFYSREKGEDKDTSNKIEKSITINGKLGASCSLVSAEETQIVVSVNVPSGNTVVISIDGTASQTLQSSSNVTFSDLIPGQDYTVILVETTPDGQKQELTYYFKTTDAGQPIDETSE